MSNELEMGATTFDNGVEAQPAALASFDAEVASLTVAAAAPRIVSVFPSQIRNHTLTEIRVSGWDLPVNDPTRYEVVVTAGIPAIDVAVVSATGVPLEVTLRLDVGFTGPGFYLLHVKGGNSVPLEILPRLQLLSLSPGEIVAGTTSNVVASGAGLPLNPGNWSVVNTLGSRVAGVQILSVSGFSTRVTLGIAVPQTTPSVAGFLRVVDGLAPLVAQIPLQILGIPQLTSVQPAQIPVGTTTVLRLSGSNLPKEVSRYTVLNGAGFPVPGAQVVRVVPILGVPLSTGMFLHIPVAASVPTGTYRLRVQIPGFASELPLQIARMPIVITSVDPNEAARGETKTVSVAGSALPIESSAYSLINSSGQPLAGVLVQVMGGTSANVDLQITITTAFVGTHRLRVQALGYVATAPFTIVRTPIFPLSDR